MEALLHYVWQHRLYPATPLATTDGLPVEIIDPGLYNQGDGPDFFNAKIRLGEQLLAGNVEIHVRASDWFRHRHEADPAYDNVILHVASVLDAEVVTHSGRQLPQLQLGVPETLAQRYNMLLNEMRYPPCWRVIPELKSFEIHAWLSALTVERLQEKTARIESLLDRTQNDWEWVLFISLARGYGFGINGEAFERWALSLTLPIMGKHRDDLFQIEALFVGQAGLLEPDEVPEERRDDHYLRLKREYDFLRHKFSLSPLPASVWKFKTRPQNSPYIRLSQLAEMWHSRRIDFSRLKAAEDIDAMRRLLCAEALPYWQTHYTFGSTLGSKTALRLSRSSLDILLINTVAPLLFAYGRRHYDEDMAERAFLLLEGLKPERNHITAAWDEVGITAAHAADSQALLQLRAHYCDRKDCLRCRFGVRYLKRCGG